MKKLILLVFLHAGILVSCTPPNGGGQSVRATGTGPTNPAAPVSTRDSTRASADGTISGGGGNGLDGKMIESYSKSIEALPEYKQFIVPVLRRLSQGQGDVLVAYLSWAARNKAWYFVPAKLPELPKERVALAFSSLDQLALHSDKEVFIDANAYSAQPAKQRAWLLMHEMVMAAKFLMKKPPAVQCEILTGTLDPAACHDETLMKLADKEGTSESASDSPILGGRDHESVRAMTVYLMDPAQPVDADSMAVTRKRLQFNFPWEQVMSRLSWAQLTDAIQRTALSEEKLTAGPSYILAASSAECTISFSNSGGSMRRVSLILKSAPNATYPELSIDMDINSEDTADLGAHVAAKRSPGGNAGEQLEDVASIYKSSGKIWTTGGLIESMTKYQRYDVRFDFHISRESRPRLREIWLVPVNTVIHTAVRTGLGSEDYESVEVKSAQPLKCQPQISSSSSPF